MRASRRSGAKGLWRHPAIFPFLLYAVGLSLVTGVLSQTFPYAIMDRMDVAGAASAQYTGPAMTMGAMATLISQLVLIPRMKLPVRSLMVYGAIMLALSSLFMVWAQDFALFAFAQILFGFGQGFCAPRLLGRRLACRHARPAGRCRRPHHRRQRHGLRRLAAASASGCTRTSPSEAPFIFCAGACCVAMAIYAYFTANARPATREAIAKETSPE